MILPEASRSAGGMLLLQKPARFLSVPESGLNEDIAAFEQFQLESLRDNEEIE
jgi:hypothetical protein